MGTHFIQPIQDEMLAEHFLPLRVVPLMPNFGARIEGIDLTQDLSEEIKTKLREAWLRFGIVIFQDQKQLTPEQQLAVARIFGLPDTGSQFVEKVDARVDVITTDENRPPVTNFWHSDNTTLPVPSLGTMIQIQQCPPIGGNTSWACVRKAYECLSPNMKRYLEGLEAVHYWNGYGHRESNYLNSTWDDATFFGKIKNFPPQAHPIVIEHPVAGTKALYVNETYTTHIKNMHRYESNAQLQFLYSWIRLPEFYVTHNWRQNDIAVWDNFTVQHYGLADYAAFRVNQRVTFVANPDADYGVAPTRAAIAAE